MIATHAPAVVRRVPPAQLRYLRLDDARSTVVREVKLPDDGDEANKYIQQAVAAYPELYFARLVVLGEGASEEVFLPRLFSAANTQVDAHSIAVVPLGGRHVNHMWRLLNGLGIPHVTLLDLDHCRVGGGWGRVRTTVKNLKQFADAPDVQARLSKVDVSETPILERAEPAGRGRRRQLVASA
ncbi:ATP-dependent nuclease [Nocardioides zeae]